MSSLAGGCHCGNIAMEFELTRTPESYRPRACDCDFCVKHNAAYLSDPEGALSLRIRDERETARYRQGSGQAEFLLCTRCGVLVAVLYRDGGRLYGAVNARAVGGGKEFGADQPVSPKTLAPDAKTKRWLEVWFSEVRVRTATGL
ncbi:MAG: GFA family protein [Bacillota bacterium]